MKNYLCKEGTETFIIKAKDLKQAKFYASMYNAQLIKELSYECR